MSVEALRWVQLSYKRLVNIILDGTMSMFHMLSRACRALKWTCTLCEPSVVVVASVIM